MSNVKDALHVGQEMITTASPKFLPALNVASIVTGLAVNVIMLVAGIRTLAATEDHPEDTKTE